MTDDTRNLLEQDIGTAIAHGYNMGKYFSLIGEQSCYMPPTPSHPVCHPLETVILGQVITDFVNKQIADELGVTLEWIDGFIDGYAGNSKVYLRSQRRSYLEGYRDGYEIEGIVRDLESSYYYPD